MVERSGKIGWANRITLNKEAPAVPTKTEMIAYGAMWGIILGTIAGAFFLPDEKTAVEVACGVTVFMAMFYGEVLAPRIAANNFWFK